MADFSVESLPVNHYFSEPLMLDDRYVLMAQEMPVTASLKKILTDWRVKTVRSNGTAQETYHGAKGEQKKDSVYFLNDTDKLRHAEEFYIDFQKYTTEIFDKFSSNNRVTFDMVAEKIKDVCEEVRINKRFLLQVQNDIPTSNDERFLASHAVKSTVISIVIGAYLKLPTHRQIELGVAALLHEIGMVRLPKSILLNKGDLSVKDKETLMLHPALGFEMLKNLDFPMVVCAAALEHHERENGAGYPRNIFGNIISLYGKIIAVTCSYEAITAKRPHREAQDAYVGVTDLLRNDGKQYDDSVLRALVFSLSVYPIGQFVLLTNGQKGQVVDVNPNDPRYPVVQVIGEQTLDGRNNIIKTVAGGIHIQKPIDKTEV
ncbi:phosphohydrolase [Spirochaetia bacterium]|nr:phosphohydrolase [Spirochaetia bacterium]